MNTVDALKSLYKTLAGKNYGGEPNPTDAEMIAAIAADAQPGGGGGGGSDTDQIKHDLDDLKEDVTAMQNGLPGMISDKMDDKFGRAIGDNVTDWLNDHVDPVGSAVVVDDTLTIEGAAADAKKTGDEITSLKEDITSLDGVLSPYIGYIGENSKDEQTNGAWISDFDFIGISGKEYFIKVLGVSSDKINTINLYFIRSNNTYQTVKAGANIGENVTAIASADFVKVRVYITFTSYPVTNLHLTANFGSTSVDIPNRVSVAEQQISEIASDISDLNGKIDKIEYNETHTTVWESAISVEFPVDGKANEKFYFSIDSLTNENTVNRIVYLMREGGTYYAAKNTPDIGQEYSYTPAGDFVSIRFYLTYATPPTGNTVTVSFGTKSKTANFESVYDEFDAVETDYIGGICAPCAIGDSLTAGLAVSKVDGLSNLVNTRWSWATQLFKKEHGTDVNIIAKSGATAKTILDEFSSEISQVTACDCVCVYLGTNQDKDGNNPYPIGDVTDIVANWNDTPTNTFIGWYSKLLKTVQHYNSQYGFIVCFGMIKSSYSDRTNAIELICENIDGCIFQPIEKYANLLNRLTDNDDGTHWSPIGYGGYKSVFKKALNEAIYNNPTVINKTANVFRP